MKFIFSILIILCSCSSSPRHIQEADRVTGYLIYNAKKNLNLNVWGIGGRMMNNIHLFDLDYTQINCVNISEARDIIIKLMKNSIDIVNNDYDIRPFLSSYPFTVENFKLTILFFKERGKLASSPNVSRVSINNGKIFYYTNEGEDDFKLVYSEFYEEVSNSN